MPNPITLNFHRRDTIILFLTLTAANKLPCTTCFFMMSYHANSSFSFLWGILIFTFNKEVLEEAGSWLFHFLYFVHAVAKRQRAVGNETAKTLVNPHFLAALQILRVLTELHSLWRITNCHTFIWQPAKTSLSLNGTAPAFIFLHLFFTMCHAFP